MKVNEFTDFQLLEELLFVRDEISNARRREKELWDEAESRKERMRDKLRRAHKVMEKSIDE